MIFWLFSTEPRKEEVIMEIGVVYPQTELNGAPEAVRAIGLATEELG